MNKWASRFLWMAAGIGALYAVSALAGVVSGGPLDPPGAPAPTMKTLANIPGSWDRLHSAAGADPCNTARFTCVLGTSAVRDNETGLVWERDLSANIGILNDAIKYCLDQNTGGRKGWRVPSAPELTSLVDTGASGFKLPTGHPFTGTGSVGNGEPHWTTTADPATPGNVLNVLLSSTGGIVTWSKDGTPPSVLERVICVRTGDGP